MNYKPAKPPKPRLMNKPVLKQPKEWLIKNSFELRSYGSNRMSLFEAVENHIKKEGIEILGKEEISLHNVILAGYNYSMYAKVKIRHRQKNKNYKKELKEFPKKEALFKKQMEKWEKEAPERKKKQRNYELKLEKYKDKLEQYYEAQIKKNEESRIKELTRLKKELSKPV